MPPKHQYQKPPGKPHERHVSKLAAELAVSAMGANIFEWGDPNKVADFCIAVARRVIDAPDETPAPDGDSD